MILTRRHRVQARERLRQLWYQSDGKLLDILPHLHANAAELAKRFDKDEPGSIWLTVTIIEYIIIVLLRLLIYWYTKKINPQPEMTIEESDLLSELP